MSIQRILTPILLTAAALPAFGGDLRVTVQPMQDPTSYSFVPSDVSFLFQQLGPESGNATHLLLEGFYNIDSSNPSWMASNYRAVEVDGGSSTELSEHGQVLIQMPSSGDVIASPVVGVVARDSAWSTYSPADPADVSIGGTAVGMSTFDPDGGTIAIAVESDSKTLTGNATYSVVDEDTVDVAAFSLSDGTNSYAFSETTLMRQGDLYMGDLISEDATPGYASIYFTLYLSDIDDVDTDSVPDLVDDDISTPSVGTWWPDITPDAGFKRTLGSHGGEPGIGYIYDNAWPYVFTYGIDAGAGGGAWIFLFDTINGASRQAFWGYVFNNNGEDYYIWGNSAWGFYYSMEDTSWHRFNGTLE